MAERAYLRPGWLPRVIGNRIVKLFGTPVLSVPGRKTGEMRSVPINVLEHEGERYPSRRGSTEWARNLRAAGAGTLKVRGRAETFRAIEIDDAKKPELIAAYKDIWLKATKSQWEVLPDPGDHPIFRVESTET